MPFTNLWKMRGEDVAASSLYGQLQKDGFVKDEGNAMISKIRRQRAPRRANEHHCTRISTLDPSKLKPGDCLDISSKSVVTLNINDQQVDFGYAQWALNSQRAKPFPPNTTGFFYFYRPPGYIIGGSIRFRIVQSPDPALFEDGRDLVSPTGMLWALTIPQLWLKHGRNPGVNTPYAILRREGLVSTEEDIQITALIEPQAKCLYFYPRSTSILGHVSQPFFLNFGVRHKLLHLVNKEGRLSYFKLWFAKDKTVYSGAGLVRYEVIYRSTKPGKKLIPVIVLRVLKILVPPNEHARYKQEEGELLKELDHRSPTGEAIVQRRVAESIAAFKELYQCYPASSSRTYISNGRPLLRSQRIVDKQQNPRPKGLGT
ncbi:hypothetical protein CC1G_03100 [Coprinopsis cinerea okayama7|uniref:Uncharacterized protein n=1 Tax=Coprinopsis cinerea (strain Okayama-7 / 130 / ATCC MYA-4618 / FGSC 9003) TaxID=240176 RepID=A8PEX9_COPC7|nr:hypothetical protein CC1G_03100 [Coprinopsis cinerea okayama7\|eukprot:XP_001840871.2 hypothetical protein CC1G_03100 [Coprinopsis cinerea okayama7\